MLPINEEGYDCLENLLLENVKCCEILLFKIRVALFSSSFKVQSKPVPATTPSL